MAVLAPVATKSSVSDSQSFVPSKVLVKTSEAKPSYRPVFSLTSFAVAIVPCRHGIFDVARKPVRGLLLDRLLLSWKHKLSRSGGSMISRWTRTTLVPVGV